MADLAPPDSAVPRYTVRRRPLLAPRNGDHALVSAGFAKRGAVGERFDLLDLEGEKH